MPTPQQYRERIQVMQPALREALLSEEAADTFWHIVETLEISESKVLKLASLVNQTLAGFIRQEDFAREVENQLGLDEAEARRIEARFRVDVFGPVRSHIRELSTTPAPARVPTPQTPPSPSTTRTFDVASLAQPSPPKPSAPVSSISPAPQPPSPRPVPTQPRVTYPQTPLPTVPSATQPKPSPFGTSRPPTTLPREQPISSEGVRFTTPSRPAEVPHLIIPSQPTPKLVERPSEKTPERDVIDLTTFQINQNLGESVKKATPPPSNPTSSLSSNPTKPSPPEPPKGNNVLDLRQPHSG
jgi:hypothetical protein